MKKLISLFAILAMVFSMQSCINSGDTPDATQTIALKGYNHIHEPAKVDAPLRNKAAKIRNGHQPFTNDDDTQSNRRH